MADDLARRAYHNEITHLRANITRALNDVDRHTTTIRQWIAGAPGSLPQTRNLGTDVAALSEYVAALKALLDVDYLVEDQP